MNFSRLGDVLTWRVNVSDLGGAGSFRFWARAGTWNPDTDDFDTLDAAPDSGLWSYDITGSTPASPQPDVKAALIVGRPTATPPRAMAGRTLAVAFPVQIQRVEPTTVIDLATGTTRATTMVTWTPARGGRISCAVTLAGRALPTRCTTFKGDVAKLSISIPKTASGKQLRVSVKVTAKDPETGKTLTKTRVVTYAVR